MKPVGPTGSGEEPEIPPELLAKLGATETQTPANNNDKSSKVRYSPVVRKLAAEKNIDLSQVKGTGLGGRVTKEDVMNFNSSADNIQRTTIEKPTSVVINPQEDETELKLTPLRRIIAENTVSPLIQDAQGALDLLWEEYPNPDVMRMAMELIEGLIDEIEETGDVSTAQELDQMLRAAAYTAADRYRAADILADRDEREFFLQFIRALNGPIARLGQMGVEWTKQMENLYQASLV